MSNSALSVGLQIETPTNNDQQNGPIMYEMNSFYFMPYVTWLKKWHRLFVQAFGLHRIQMADMDHTIDGVSLTKFRQPLQVQSHLEMPGILVQLGHIQCT